MLRQNMTMEFGMDLINLNRTIELLEKENTELALKGAKYKAYFYHKDSLVEKLETQIKKNILSYASGFNMEYRTLEDMVIDGLLTKEEYKFCIL